MRDSNDNDALKTQRTYNNERPNSTTGECLQDAESGKSVNKSV